jgi:hypothetical protein
MWQLMQSESFAGCEGERREFAAVVAADVEDGLALPGKSDAWHVRHLLR